MDFIGYGRSDKPPDHLATIAQGVPDLLAATDFIMKTRNAGPLMLVGFSSGALRAALFAQHHPDRVKRLALDAMVYTGKGSPTLKKRAEKLDQWKSSVTRPIDPAFLMSTMTRDHSETAMESRMKPYVDAILAIETTVPNGTYIDMCANLPVCDPKQIKVPTAILRGQYDGIASRRGPARVLPAAAEPGQGVRHDAGDRARCRHVEELPAVLRRALLVLLAAGDRVQGLTGGSSSAASTSAVARLKS